MTGKAISLAVRTHLFVDAALNALLYSEALSAPVPHLRDADTENEERGIDFLNYGKLKYIIFIRLDN